MQNAAVSRKATGMPSPVAPSYENVDRVLDASDNIISLLGRLRLPPRLAVVTLAITLQRLCDHARVELFDALQTATLVKTVKPVAPVQDMHETDDPRS